MQSIAGAVAVLAVLQCVGCFGGFWVSQQKDNLINVLLPAAFSIPMFVDVLMLTFHTHREKARNKSKKKSRNKNTIN